MNKIKPILFIIIFIFSKLILKSQSFLPDYVIEFGSQINLSDTTPFWLVSNQFGKNSIANNSIFLDLQLKKNISSEKFFNYAYGIELFNKVDTNYKPILHQAYIKLKIWELLIQAGRFEEFYSNQDSTISSGSIIYSQNTRPMTKIIISSNGYVTVPFTFNKLELKGLFAHGWFEDDIYVENILLHHKNLYGRIGGDWPVNIHYGLEHVAQWGGNSPDTSVGQMPVDFDSFIRVIKAEEGDSNKVIPDEVINKYGNHIGSRNVGIDVQLKKYTFGVYRQSIFEDGSGKRRMNFPDGLWGIYFKTKEKNLFISKVVYEFIYTLDQSGPIHDWSRKLGGNDNYFNHYIYKSGWTYYGYTMGTPLITSPNYNQDDSIILKNNRVMVHHLGIEGKISSINYRTYFSYSYNYGTHSNPFSPVKNNFSFFLDFSLPIKLYYNFKLNTKCAFDLGKMYGNNFGFIISLNKNGCFSEK